jgi:hypothetical protein
MADIDVVKKRTTIWPWIILALVLGVVLFLLFGTDPAGSPTAGTSPVLDGAHGVAAMIA